MGMTVFTIIFICISGACVFIVRPRHVLLPVLAGLCFMTGAERVAIGPFNFTALRILIILAALRGIIVEKLRFRLCKMDVLMLFWAGWLLWSSFFHTPFNEALVFRLGAIYNAAGFYLIVRLYVKNEPDLVAIIHGLAILIIPVSLEMLYEKCVGTNLFSMLSGTPPVVLMRGSGYRANGPFGHAILAGTFGALCIPLFLGVWNSSRRFALIGVGMAAVMIFASYSSGPIMTAFSGLVALIAWRWRNRMKGIRFLAVVAYIGLNLAMNDPAYYVLARIDLTGSSTGWHRAALIEASIKHLGEWWIIGTDYTRHWMPYGIIANENHCDITNHYLLYGVWAGLPLMGLYIALIWCGFDYIGRLWRARLGRGARLVWSLGAALFANAVTAVSVAYFDQTVVILYLTLGAIAALSANQEAREEELVPFQDFEAVPDQMIVERVWA